MFGRESLRESVCLCACVCVCVCTSRFIACMCELVITEQVNSYVYIFVSRFRGVCTPMMMRLCVRLYVQSFV